MSNLSQTQLNPIGVRELLEHRSANLWRMIFCIPLNKVTFNLNKSLNNFVDKKLLRGNKYI